MMGRAELSSPELSSPEMSSLGVLDNELDVELAEEFAAAGSEAAMSLRSQ